MLKPKIVKELPLQSHGGKLKITSRKEKCTGIQQWLKKHRGFGGKLKVLSFD